MRLPSGCESGRRAGRYVLANRLGRGGMAEVFAGHVLGDHGFQKPVAIKRLLPELANDEVFVARLIEEAKLLVGMQHGNIVSVLDLARDGEDVFLVMEYVDGPSLRQLMKARGPRGLSLAIASYIVQAAAAGLEFAHARPGGAIIHADVSPSNLLLTSSGEVRVADFGIARREGGGHGLVEGKWAYMAPEQARGEPLSPSSDVFALGVVLYELVTGRHPFGHRITASERERQPVRVIPPRIVRPEVPTGLDAICMRALAHDPRERYARMQHLIDALVDERFANQWRDGAAELALAIRDHRPPGPASDAPRPAPPPPVAAVTLVTRSLIELTPVASGPFALGTSPARVSVAGDVPGDVPGDVLGEQPGEVLPPGPSAARARRWPLAVLSLAALCGVTAAVAVGAGPREIAHASPPAVAEHAAALPAPNDTPDDTPDDTPGDTLDDAPVAPAPEVVPAEVESAPSSPEAPVPDPPEPDRAPAAATPSARTTEPRRAPAPAPTPEPLATSKKKEPGWLRVRAFPWAWVQIDGGPRREALGAKFSLSPGRHTVKLFNDVGAVKTRTVVIRPGKVTTVRVNFEDDTFEELD